MTATEELLPCPFCGGEAKLIEGRHSAGGDVFQLYGVICLAAEEGIYGTEHSIYGYFYEYQAIEAWNTRAELAAKPKKDKLGYAYCGECGWNVGSADAPFPYCSHCGRKVEE